MYNNKIILLVMLALFVFPDTSHSFYVERGKTAEWVQVPNDPPLNAVRRCLDETVHSQILWQWARTNLSVSWGQWGASVEQHCTMFHDIDRLMSQYPTRHDNDTFILFEDGSGIVNGMSVCFNYLEWGCD